MGWPYHTGSSWKSFNIFGSSWLDPLVLESFAINGKMYQTAKQMIFWQVSKIHHDTSKPWLMFKATHGLPAFQVCDMWDICSLQQPDEPHRITWPWHDLCEMVLTNFTNGKTYCILSVWNNYKLRGNPHHGLGHLLVLSEAILVLLCFPQYKSQMISHSTSVRRPNCVQSFVVSPLVVYIYTYIMLYTSIMWWFLYDHLENWCLSLSVYSTSHMQIIYVPYVHVIQIMLYSHHIQIWNPSYNFVFEWVPPPI